jgi:hypothetical protein
MPDRGTLVLLQHGHDLLSSPGQHRLVEGMGGDLQSSSERAFLRYRMQSIGVPSSALKSFSMDSIRTT